MADLENTATIEEEDSMAKFAEEFQNARSQPHRTEEPEEEPTQVAEAGEEEEKETAEVQSEGTETVAPEGDAAETEEVVEAEADSTADETDSKITKYLVPDHESFGELRGKRATAAELEEAGLLDKMFTRAHQEMHHTKLYQDLKKKFDEDLEAKLKEAGVGQPKEAAPAEVDPKTFGDEIERNFKPHLEALAKAGSFEPDFVEAYPRLASHLAHQFQSFRLVGAGLVKAVQEIKNHVDGQVNRESTTSNMDHLNNAMVGVASDDPLYASLNDASERKLFVEWMKSPDNTQPWKKMDIVDELAQPDILKGAYAAFRTATRHLREAPSTPPAGDTRRERANLAGAGGGTSRPATSKPDTNEFDELKAGIEGARAQRFGR